MKSMRVTPTRLFLILTVTLSYITISGVWLIHFAPNLIGSSSEFEVVAGFFGVSVWLIANGCLYLHITTPKPGQPANTTEKGAGVRSVIIGLVASGDMGGNEARQLLSGLDSLSPFNIDDRVRLVADAKRYRHLRDKACVEGADNDLMVVRGDRYFDGVELDTEIDNAIRLARLEELHPCAD